jgi:hypothetical protein
VLLGVPTAPAASPSGPFIRPATMCRQAADRDRCARISPMRVTKKVVRPGRKKGMTTIVFAVRRHSPVRFTVVRVYPTCKRVGSFTVNAHAGKNRIRFSGRLGGRPLTEGVYRILAQVRGQEKAVATATVVVAKNLRNARKLRRVRTTACSRPQAETIEAAIGAFPIDPANGVVGTMLEPVKGAVQGVAKTAKKLATTAQAVPRKLADVIPGEGLSDKIFLTLVALGLLMITLMSTVVLMSLVRFGYRERIFR